MGSRVVWWRPITNPWTRSTEDPHHSGINYSLPCLRKFRDCYQLRGTFLLFSVVSGVRHNSQRMLMLLRWNQVHTLNSQSFSTLSIDDEVVYTPTWIPAPLSQINKLLMKLMKQSASDLLQLRVRNHTSCGSRSNLLFWEGKLECDFKTASSKSSQLGLKLDIQHDV